MPIEVKTVYTREILLRFSDALGKRRFFLWLMLAVGTALVCSFSVCTALLIGWSLELVLYIVFALLWDAFGIFMTFGLPRLTVKKNPVLNATVEYTFFDDRFQVRGNSALSSELAENRYAILEGVISSGNDLYLMFNTQQGCIVDLQNLSRKQISQLYNTLKDHFPANRFQWKVK